MTLPEVYIVGGWVRDALGAVIDRTEGLRDLGRAALLLRRQLSDGGEIDLCGPLDGEALGAALDAAGLAHRMEQVNARTGTWLVRTARGRYEYTPFRRESYAPGGAHTPRSVTLGATLEEDALRRDFRCNAVYYDPVRAVILDPVGGVADIRARRLGAVYGSATLARDGLRLMRLVRFAVTLGYAIEPATYAAARAGAALLGDIAPERRLGELRKTLGAQPERNLAAAALYRELGLMPRLGGEAFRPDALRVARRYPLLAFCYDCAGGDAARAAAPAAALRLPKRERALLAAACGGLGGDPTALCAALASDPEARGVLTDLAAGAKGEALAALLARFDRLATPCAPRDLALSATEIAALTGLGGAALGAFLQKLWARVVRDGIVNDARVLRRLLAEGAV